MNFDRLWKKVNVSAGTWGYVSGEIGSVPMLMVKVAKPYHTRMENDEINQNAQLLASSKKTMELLIEGLYEIEGLSNLPRTNTYKGSVETLSLSPYWLSVKNHIESILGLNWEEIKKEM